jgi:hypothetical protein
VRAIAAAAVLAIAAGGVGGACRASSPAPSSPAPSSATDVYYRLTDGGCLSADDAALGFVAAEIASPTAPGWIMCMVDGGSVAGCGAPCAPPVTPDAGDQTQHGTPARSVSASVAP